MKQVLLMEKDINPAELDFLLRYPAVPSLVSPVDFLSNLSWGGIKVSRLRLYYNKYLRLIRVKHFLFSG